MKKLLLVFTLCLAYTFLATAGENTLNNDFASDDPDRPSRKIATLPGTNSVLIGWVNGDRTNRIIVMKEIGGRENFFPTDGTFYFASSEFGVPGALVGDENFIVYNDSGVSGETDDVFVIGLKPNTDYQVRIYDYSFVNGVPKYKTDKFNTETFSTTAGSLNLDAAVSMYPNPLTSEGKIILNGDMMGKEVTVAISDLYNNTTKEIRFSGNEFAIDRSDFKSGLHVAKILVDGQFVETIRFMVK